MLPNYRCHYHRSVTLRPSPFECVYGAFSLLVCVILRSGSSLPCLSFLLCLFFSSFFPFSSDPCLAIITSLTFLFHISVHSSCTLIVNTLQNRDIVQPAAVNPSVVAKRKIAMREDVHHCFLRVRRSKGCTYRETRRVHKRNKQIKHNDDVNSRDRKHSNLENGENL